MRARRARKGAAPHAETGPAGATATDEHPPEPARVQISLSSNWDASLSYDILEQVEPRDAPIFVGRAELVGPIVNAIAAPDRRGTYLISGYRGAGKTSLVIEAANRARSTLEGQGWQLLPVVLNVSEVSASLEDVSETAARPLQIDARRLLTALLRQLKNKIPAIKQASADGDREAALVKQISQTYTKASATQYSARSTQRSERRFREIVQSQLNIALPNMLKYLAAGAGLIAVGVEGAVLFGPAAAALHVLALGLAAGAVVSYRRSRTMSQTSDATDTAEIEWMYDASIHQLENDLKDIFTKLNEQKLRTIVVLEELDKVDDEEGKQLEAVIRYFKNLFTQAPALFFFLTDKQYFDVIEAKIADARKRRSYSIEHTFFTHRLFVNRPTVGDCLKYLEAVAEEPSREAIRAIAKSDTERVRPLKSMDLHERLIRTLLFRAQDHIFDLKNELRRYIHVDDGKSILECDEETLPLNEQATAAFQFLVEQKARSFGFRGGREYANEVLRNCLFAVFGDSDPGEPRELRDFHPLEGPGGDQVGSNEQRSIRDAVASLIEELERGGAVERDPSNGRFTWQENAALLFSPVARLESHEEMLAQGLERHRSVLAALRAVVPDTTALDDVLTRFKETIERIHGSGRPMPREEANAQTSSADAEVAKLLADVFERHLDRVATRGGWSYDRVAEAPTGIALRMLRPNSEESASGGVMLVYGTGERVRQGVATLVASMADDARMSLVHVAAEPEANWAARRQELVDDWLALFGTGLVVDKVSCSILRLHAGLEAGASETAWRDHTVDELVLAEIWAEQAWQRLQGVDVTAPPDGPYVLMSRGTDDLEFGSVTALLEGWLASNDELLCCLPRHLDLSMVAGAFAKPIAQGRPAVYSPGIVSMRDQAAKLWSNSLPSDVEVRLESFDRLLRSGRVVLGIQGQSSPPPGHRIPSTAAVVLSGDPWSSSAPIAPATGVAALLRGTDDPEAVFELGQIVRNWDALHAQSLFENAAENGHAEAMGNLAWQLVDEAPEAAATWRERLVATGNVGEIERLAGALYENHAEQARELDEAAATRGSPSAMRRLATQLLAEDRAQASVWIERLIQTEQTLEIETLAEELADRDGAIAAELLEAAAESGSASAMARLAWGLVPVESERASVWRERLVATGNIEWIEWLATRLLEKGDDEAQALYEAAAEHDSPSAIAWLALFHAEPEVRRSWRKRVVENGDVPEIRHIVEAALAHDPDEAEMWVELGEESQDKEIRAAIADGVARVDSGLAERLLNPPPEKGTSR